jgi:hypothetical protein
MSVSPEQRWSHFAPSEAHDNARVGRTAAANRILRLPPLRYRRDPARGLSPHPISGAQPTSHSPRKKTQTNPRSA